MHTAHGAYDGGHSTAIQATPAHAVRPCPLRSGERGQCNACAWLLWRVRIGIGCWALAGVLCRSWNLICLTGCPKCCAAARSCRRLLQSCIFGRMALRVRASRRVSEAARLTRAPGAQVGSQFVQQFYTVLHSSPKYLHRFYTNASTMTHADAERSPPEFTVQTQDVSPGPLCPAKVAASIVATSLRPVLLASDASLWQRHALSCSIRTFVGSRPPCLRRMCNGPQEINRKVVELGFDEAVTEIWSVDSQYSAGDGVIVQVTGCQQCKARNPASL